MVHLSISHHFLYDFSATQTFSLNFSHNTHFQFQHTLTILYCLYLPFFSVFLFDFRVFIFIIFFNFFFKTQIFFRWFRGNFLSLVQLFINFPTQIDSFLFLFFFCELLPTTLCCWLSTDCLLVEQCTKYHSNVYVWINLTFNSITFS